MAVSDLPPLPSPPLPAAAPRGTPVSRLTRCLQTNKAPTKNTFCCLARRHKVMNDARRRVAHRAGKQAGFVNMHEYVPAALPAPPACRRRGAAGTRVRPCVAATRPTCAPAPAAAAICWSAARPTWHATSRTRAATCARSCCGGTRARRGGTRRGRGRTRRGTRPRYARRHALPWFPTLITIDIIT